MQILNSKGEIIYVNDDAIASYQNHLHNIINEYILKLQETTSLSKEEEEDLKDKMYQYNQIVDLNLEDDITSSFTR